MSGAGAAQASLAAGDANEGDQLELALAISAAEAADEQDRQLQDECDLQRALDESRREAQVGVVKQSASGDYDNRLLEILD